MTMKNDLFDKPKLLIAEDEPSQRMLLKMLLENEGYHVFETDNGLDALNIYKDNPDIRLLVTDINMPLMDGFDLITRLRQEEIRYAYIIVLTSSYEKDTLIKALSIGADDFIVKPVLHQELKLRLEGAKRLLKLEGSEELIFSMATLSEYRSEETGLHLKRVEHYTKEIATYIATNMKEFNLSVATTNEIARVSPLHDIGKVAIPDNILHKPGPLDNNEFEIMKTHASIGGSLIKEIYDRTGHSFIKIAYEIAMYHHEKWDGSGYPAGLKGDSIPFPAQIFSIVDAYDALTSDRCYRKAMSHEDALKIIRDGNEKHFSPKIFEIFEANLDEIIKIKDKFKD
jgi:putative two-component system response regulator